jgi:hypothetical protein
MLGSARAGTSKVAVVFIADEQRAVPHRALVSHGPRPCVRARGGCPGVVDPGIGDRVERVERHRVAMVTELMHGSAPETAQPLLALLDAGAAVRARCVEIAERDVGVEAGAERHDALHRRIVGAGR